MHCPFFHNSFIIFLLLIFFLLKCIKRVKKEKKRGGGYIEQNGRRLMHFVFCFKYPTLPASVRTGLTQIVLSCSALFPKWRSRRIQGGAGGEGKWRGRLQKMVCAARTSFLFFPPAAGYFQLIGYEGSGRPESALLGHVVAPWPACTVGWKKKSALEEPGRFGKAV